jgi:hypothetical protein
MNDYYYDKSHSFPFTRHYLLYYLYYGHIRWQYNICMSAHDRTPGYFIHIYLYTHAHRLRLEKLLYLELSSSFNGILNHSRI